MRFEIVGDGVDLGPIELDFDLESQNSLRIGDIHINAKTLDVQLGLVEDLSPVLLPFMTEDERADSYLIMKWPEALLTEGVVEAISQSGRVLWKIDASKSEIMKWKDFQGEIRARAADKIRKGELDELPIMTATWAYKSFLRNNNEFVNAPEPFRFCITQVADEGQSRLCMPYMEFIKKDRKWFIQKTPEPIRPARVILSQKESPLKVRRVIRPGTPIQFLADLSEGHIYQFSSKPPQINIMELVRVVNQGVKVVGHGQVPSRAHQVLNPAVKNVLISAIGWGATIGDFREFWETRFPENEPTLFFRGPGGGLFRQDYKIKRLPREELRPYLHRRTLDGTYVDGKKLYGIKATKTQVSSKENEVTLVDGAPDEFIWKFGAKKRGELNASRVQIRDGKEYFKAYTEIFKGYPGEASFRMPLILGTGGNFLAAGEFAANYWFDTVGGWSNYFLSNQRWGVGAKYMQTLTQVKINSKNIENPEFNREYSAPLKTVALDLKYRLQPGLWNQDETVGLILGYNNANYDFFKGNMLGVGAFWARSMPKVFDDLFNKLPFMRYPKFVDMEYIYYVQSLDTSTVNLKHIGANSSGNWSLNFHGKIHWKKSIFGEAGFGIKSLDYSFRNKGDDGQNTSVSSLGFRFALFYGTFGLGYQF